MPTATPTTASGSQQQQTHRVLLLYQPVFYAHPIEQPQPASPASPARKHSGTSTSLGLRLTVDTAFGGAPRTASGSGGGGGYSAPVSPLSSRRGSEQAGILPASSSSYQAVSSSSASPESPASIVDEAFARKRVARSKAGKSRSPSPPPLARSLSQPQEGQEGRRGVLDLEHSRPIAALQDAGRHVIEYLEDRIRRGSFGKSRARDGKQKGKHQPRVSSNATSSTSVVVDMFSILPASYTRSNHPAFHHNSSSAFAYSTPSSTSSAAHRTISHSSSGSGRSTGSYSNLSHTQSRRRSAGFIHSVGSGSQRRSREDHAHHGAHGPLAGLAHLLRRYSPSPSRSNSRGPSRRGSIHSVHSAYSNDIPPAVATSPTAALLELTDVLRIEDEEAEEAREQILDRLTILAGEVDAHTATSDSEEEQGGISSVNVDVRQAADGESLLEALHSLVKERGEGYFDELIVLNDAEWNEWQLQQQQQEQAAKNLDESAANPAGGMLIQQSSSEHNSAPTNNGKTHSRRRPLAFKLSKLHFHIPHASKLSHEEKQREREEQQEHDRVAIAGFEDIKRDLHHDLDTRTVEVVAM